MDQTNESRDERPDERPPKAGRVTSGPPRRPAPTASRRAEAGGSAPCPRPPARRRRGRSRGWGLRGSHPGRRRPADSAV